eukprot:m.478675 g.478675  ORF g.478675 m.478675 type:complete len:319 (+) comp21694_c0_seq18:294-1250(+)
MTPRSRAMYTDDATNGRQQSTHVRFSCCVNTSRKMACTSEEHARRTFATTIDPASLLLSSTALSSAGAPPMSAPGSTVEAGGAACPRRRSLRLARGDPTATSGALLPATVPARRKLASAPVKSCKANATSAAAISLVRRPAGLPLRTSRSSRSMSASTCCNRTSAAWTDARMVCRAAASRSMHARLRARWARIAATSGDICWETVCMRARQVVNASCNATMLSMAATSRCIRAVCIVAAYSKALFCSDRCCNLKKPAIVHTYMRFLLVKPVSVTAHAQEHTRVTNCGGQVTRASCVSLCQNAWYFFRAQRGPVRYVVI